ncbi:MAG TPA: gluconate 2-dehydrogenase subunit 3 family protein [Egibacteraceae bacterium]|nr:gluconate 2-dehydrogenase subunit 3 family protein [Egibacteraceae bacterium]
MDAATDPTDGRRRLPLLNRRRFLTGSALVAGAGVIGTACDRDTETWPEEPVGAPQITPRDAAPVGPARDALQFFNPDQAAAVDAMIARLIPGDQGDPGAREAGVLFYIDHLLATHTGWAEKTYTMGPFAAPYEGEQEPPAEEGVVWVPEDELERYGWQTGLVPREIYQMGLPRLDALAQERFGDDFADLDDGDADELLRALEDDEDDDVGEIFDEVSAGDFFDLVLKHTLEGFLGDPVYGGNRNMAGWRLIGFPGSRRSYSPGDMQNERFHLAVEPQSLLDLPPFNAHHDHDREHDKAFVTVRKRHPNGPID